MSGVILMPVNSSHPDYTSMILPWLTMRDVLAGEEAVKLAGIRYLPRLDSQSDAEYLGYKSRACFFNATARTCDGFLGLFFRRDPEVKLPEGDAGAGAALRAFTVDADLLGTSLFTYCKGVVSEVLAVGRCGTLVDWGGIATGHSGGERAYVVRYAAEDILNWQTACVNGRNMLTLVSLREVQEVADAVDPFLVRHVESIRVLRLQPVSGVAGALEYGVEIWHCAAGSWELMERRRPLRQGKALDQIPFVFHGPRNALPAVDKMPLADIVHVNLDHYRLDADYKHGLHFTALPTAWVSGFDKTTELRIGSSTAWVADSVGAVAGFLEFRGHDLIHFLLEVQHEMDVCF